VLHLYVPDHSSHSSDEDDRRDDRRGDSDSSQEDDSFIAVPKRKSPSVSSLSDKENSSKQPPAKSKKKPRTDSSSKAKKKKQRSAKRKQHQASSDDSSAFQTSRSVLGNVAQANLQLRRVSYSEDTMARSKTSSKQIDGTVRTAPGMGTKRRNEAISTSESEVEDDTVATQEERIARLNSRLLDKNIKITNFRHKVDDLRSEKRTLGDKVAMLVAKINDMEKAALNVPLGVPVNEGFNFVVDSRTRGPVWQKTKFIANDKEMDKIMKKLMLGTDHGRDALDGLSEVEQNTLVRSYSLTYGKLKINPLINNRRSVTQTALSKAFMKRTKAGMRIPTPKTLLQIIKRKGLRYTIEEGKTEPTPANKAMVLANREIFDWYAGTLVGKVCGQQYWGTQKFHGHLSTWAPPENPTVPYVSAGSEAFVQLMYENCEVKWSYQMRRIRGNKAINDKHVKMDTYLYSDRKSGQNCYGGWKEAGRARFKALREEITK
jgi:hypothetical protein